MEICLKCNNPMVRRARTAHHINNGEEVDYLCRNCGHRIGKNKLQALKETIRRAEKEAEKNGVVRSV